LISCRDGVCNNVQVCVIWAAFHLVVSPVDRSSAIRNNN
jgi:hypothetical protein